MSLTSSTCGIIRLFEGLLEEQTIVTMKGKVEINDITNKLVSRVVISEKGNALMNGVFGFFGKKEEPKPVDKNELQIKIFKRVENEKIVFGEGAGNFARYLQIDKKVYYAHSKVKPFQWQAEVKEEFTLPSSSILRKDLELINEKKIEEAQKFIN